MAYRLNGPAVLSPTATTGVSDMRFLGGGCNVILKDRISRQFLGGSLNQRLKGRRFHINEEVEMALWYSCKYKNPIYAATGFLKS